MSGGDQIKLQLQLQVHMHTYRHTCPSHPQHPKRGPRRVLTLPSLFSLLQSCKPFSDRPSKQGLSPDDRRLPMRLPPSCGLVLAPRTQRRAATRGLEAMGREQKQRTVTSVRWKEGPRNAPLPPRTCSPRSRSGARRDLPADAQLVLWAAQVVLVEDRHQHLLAQRKAIDLEDVVAYLQA